MVARHAHPFIFLLKSFLRMLYIYIYINYIFYFILGCARSLLVCPAFSSCSRQGLLVSCGAWASHCGDVSRCRVWALWPAGFSGCSTDAQYLPFPGSRAQAQDLWGTGLVALQLVGASRPRDQTCVSCIGKWVLYHWATREAPWVSRVKFCKNQMPFDLAYYLLRILSSTKEKNFFSSLLFLFFKFFSFIFISWGLIILQYWSGFLS